MILTVTPNPAFDRFATVPGFTPGKVCRSTALELCAGGKGVNVARAVHSLGGAATCTGFLGGHTGRLQAECLARDGIPAHWTWVEGETRVSTIIMAPDAAGTTVLNEEGPAVTAQDWDRLQADVLALAGTARWVCLCGSLPPGIPSALAGQLVEALHRRNIPACVDSSGEALRSAMDARPAIIKINGAEAATLLGWSGCEDAASAARAAQAIRRSGIPTVILTLGALGALLATGAGTWHATPPPIPVTCPVGSGDSFLAGFILAQLRGLPAPEALRGAVAAGTANALSVKGGAFSATDCKAIQAGVDVHGVNGSSG